MAINYRNARVGRERRAVEDAIEQGVPPRPARGFRFAHHAPDDFRRDKPKNSWKNGRRKQYHAA